MLQKGWGPYHIVEEGKPDKHEWFRIDLGHDPYTSHFQMMLDSDICLAFKTNEAQPKEFLAKNSNCCVWIDPTLLFLDGEAGTFCGMSYTNTQANAPFDKTHCCGHSDLQDLPDCNDIKHPNGFAYEDVIDFAQNQDHFFQAYKEAWWIATENGHNDLKPLYTENTLPEDLSDMDLMMMSHDMGTTTTTDHDMTTMDATIMQ